MSTPLAKTLAAARRDYGLTMAEVARKLGIHYTMYWRWEHGYHAPSGPHLRALCAFYDLPIGEVFRLGETNG